MTLIRLACVECDRRDHDGVPEIPADWLYLSSAEVTDDLLEELAGVDVAPQWYTHLAVCPDCLRKGKEEVTALATR